jgi:hypothetical protein
MSYSAYENYMDLIPVESFAPPMFAVLLIICVALYLSLLNTDARLDQLENMLLEIKAKELQKNFVEEEVDTEDIPDAETQSDAEAETQSDVFAHAETQADAETETYTHESDKEVQSEIILDDAEVEASLERPVDENLYVNLPLLDHAITDALSSTPLSTFHILRHANKHLEVKVKRPQLVYRLEFMGALGYLSKSNDESPIWSLKV